MTGELYEGHWSDVGTPERLSALEAATEENHETERSRSALHGARRARLAQAMQGGVAVMPTAPERIRNRDTHYPYRFDSHFYYLTGFPEPEAVLVIVAGAQPKSLLFCREKNEERETWDGFRFGPQGARSASASTRRYPISELDAKLAELLGDQPALYYPVGADAAWDARAMGWLNAVRAKRAPGVGAPERVQDVRALIDEMRLVKDAHELGVMRRAASISAGGAPARDARRAPGTLRIRARSRAAARVPPQRRGVSGLLADRRRRRQRLRAALRVQRRARCATATWC